MRHNCHVCHDRLLNYKDYLCCSLCNKFSHSKCNGLSKTDASLIMHDNTLLSEWSCKLCTTSSPLPINEHMPVNSDTDPITSKKCHCCNNLLGKRYSLCDYCDKRVHNRCFKHHFGCISCKNDIFPRDTDIFSGPMNDLVFDPFNPEHAFNSIGEDTSSDSELLLALSKNLNKCKYTTIDHLSSKQDEFSILSLNIRSLKSNFDKLKDSEDILSLKFDIICLQETNIDPLSLFNPQFYDLKGFHSPLLQRPVRNSGKGGGLAIYLNKKFETDYLKVVPDLCDHSSTETGEFLFAELKTDKKSKNIVIGNFYRSPSHRPDQFCEHLNNIFESMSEQNKNKNIILLGDANIDLLTHDTFKPAQDLINVISRNGLIPVISRPTHVSDTYATLIDHIYTNCIANFRNSGIITDPFADHLGIFVKISLGKKTPSIKQPTHYTYTDYSQDNIESFKNIISNTDWTPVRNTSDPNDKYHMLHTIFSAQYNKTFPTTRRKCNNRKAEGKPWIMPWLQEACDRKNKLYNKFIDHPSTENKAAYTKMKKWVEKQLYKRKKNYYSSQIEKYTSNAKKQWKIINEVISNTKPRNKINKLNLGNQIISDSKNIAESFNTYFCSIAGKLKSEIPLSNHKLLPNFKQVHNSIFLKPCTESEISDLVKQLKNTSTSDFNSAVIKQVFLNTSLAQILSETINSSLSHGVFPELLKTARVIPIHKSGSRSDVANYRPISLLSVFSKIYEKVMYSRLTSFFAANNIISPRQYGFRRQHSCEHALIDAHSTILSALNNKQIALLLLIDFSKAFDMVDHDILLKKLSRYGIRGTAYSWLQSYLSSRKQYVYVNDSSSSLLDLRYGVPQGSILGPLLFIIYINDLPNISKNIHFIMYADDANIIVTGSDIEDVKAKISALLIKLLDWVNMNSLKLNVKKTHYMIFSNTHKSTNKEYNLNLKINNEPILQSHEERFLGVIMDDKLSWSAHRAAISMRISRNAGVLFRARHMFKIPTLKTLYFSFIQSHLVYCSTIWGTGSKHSLRSIFVAQKKAIRAISFTRLFTKNKETEEYTYGHTKPLFSSLEILTIHNLILLQLLSQMHKIYGHLAPAHTRSLFTAHQPPASPPKYEILPIYNPALNRKAIVPANIIHPKRIDSVYFSIPTARLAKHRKSLLYLGPLLYNDICNKVQEKMNEKYKIHRFTPKSFSLNMKKHILAQQALGSSDEWDAINTPMYTTSTSTVITRSQNTIQ